MKNLFFVLTFLMSLGFVSLNAQCSSSSKHTKKTSYQHNSKTIVDIAVGSDQTSTLVAAVKAADLVETLAGKGPFTVFAPSNSAFAKLPAGTIDQLLQPANKSTLTNILTYHVVAGKFDATSVINAISSGGGKASFKMVNGGTLTATTRSGQVLLEDEKGNISAVTATDLDASNGVVHLIDSVVMPR